jgi:hypothetical protein
MLARVGDQEVTTTPRIEDPKTGVLFIRMVWSMAGKQGLLQGRY